MGGMEIYGSYIGKERSLTGEAVIVAALDTFVALVAGLIVFPACFAYGISPDSGPSLIFLTLPRVFSTMPNGRLWGSLFFLFLFFAAESTMIGVFENDVSFSIDLKGMTRGKAALISGIVITVCSIPCALGFNVWSGVHLLGAGKNIMDVEDFFVSTICLPVGSLIFTLFCAPVLVLPVCAAGARRVPRGVWNRDVLYVKIQHPSENDEGRTERLLTGRLHQFPRSGQAAKPLCPPTARHAKRSEPEGAGMTF